MVGMGSKEDFVRLAVTGPYKHFTSVRINQSRKTVYDDLSIYLIQIFIGIFGHCVTLVV